MGGRTILAQTEDRGLCRGKPVDLGRGHFRDRASRGALILSNLGRRVFGQSVSGSPDGIREHPPKPAHGAGRFSILSAGPDLDGSERSAPSPLRRSCGFFQPVAPRFLSDRRPFLDGDISFLRGDRLRFQPEAAAQSDLPSRGSDRNFYCRPGLGSLVSMESGTSGGRLFGRWAGGCRRASISPAERSWSSTPEEPPTGLYPGERIVALICGSAKSNGSTS